MDEGSSHRAEVVFEVPGATLRLVGTGVRDLWFPLLGGQGKVLKRPMISALEVISDDAVEDLPTGGGAGSRTPS